MPTYQTYILVSESIHESIPATLAYVATLRETYLKDVFFHRLGDALVQGPEKYDGGPWDVDASDRAGVLFSELDAALVDVEQKESVYPVFTNVDVNSVPSVLADLSTIVVASVFLNSLLVRAGLLDRTEENIKREDDLQYRIKVVQEKIKVRIAGIHICLSAQL